MGSAVAAVRVALLHGIAPTESVVVGEEWRTLLDSASRERIVGLLHAAITDGEVRLPAPAVPELEELHRDAMKFDVRVDSVVRDVAAGFQRDGVEWRVLKGVATARLLYDEPGKRHTGDLDVLVRESDFERAIDVVNFLGATTPVGVMHGNRVRDAQKARSFLHPRGVEIDVHRRVQALHQGSALSESFSFARSTPLVVAGVEVKALSRSGLFLHSCLHLATADTRLSTMADLLRMLHHDDFDIDEALAMAQNEGVAGYVDWAIERTTDWVRLSDRVAESQRRHRVPARDRLLARYYQSHPLGVQLRDTVTGPGRLSRLAELLWPSPPFLRNMKRNRPQQLLHLGARMGGFVRPHRGRLRADYDPLHPGRNRARRGRGERDEPPELPHP